MLTVSGAAAKSSGAMAQYLALELSVRLVTVKL
jgi:hypothetical protein